MSANYTEWTSTARHAFRCESWPCFNEVTAGEHYVRAVAFPGHDANTGDRPWVMRVCRECATRYGKSMPPKRSRQGAV